MCESSCGICFFSAETDPRGLNIGSSVMTNADAWFRLTCDTAKNTGCRVHDPGIVCAALGVL